MINEYLILRSARSARLEGSATPRLLPTLRNATGAHVNARNRVAPQGEVVLVRTS
jgi:hypothetical protein